jgi:hypothetical protein
MPPRTAARRTHNNAPNLVEHPLEYGTDASGQVLEIVRRDLVGDPRLAIASCWYRFDIESLVLTAHEARVFTSRRRT